MVYGATSLVGGVVLLAGAGVVWWSAAGDLLTALLSGNLPDMVVGVVLVGPFAAGLPFSALGLVLEAIGSGPPARESPAGC